MRICIVWVGPFVYTATHRMGGPPAYRPAHTRTGFNIERATTAARMTVDKVVKVAAIDAATAAELLRKSLVGRKTADNYDVVVAAAEAAAAGELLKALTFLPLAILLTAAYVNETGIALAQHTALL